MTRASTISRYVLTALYAIAGVLHLVLPAPFLSITPRWVPWPEAVIAATGLCEIAGAFGLMIPRTRRLAAIMLALYALCVFPANVQHAINDVSHHRGLGWGYHAPRLAAQPFIIWWALIAGGVAPWPWRRRHLTTR